MQYEIRFYIKIPESKALSILVDGNVLKKQNGKYIWTCNGGKHRLRIEEDKMFKSKWFWVYAPLTFLISVLIGFIVFVGIGAEISSLTIGVGLSGAIFSWLISAIFIIVWIFFIYKLYRHSEGKYKK